MATAAQNLKPGSGSDFPRPHEWRVLRQKIAPPAPLSTSAYGFLALFPVLFPFTAPTSANKSPVQGLWCILTIPGSTYGASLHPKGFFQMPPREQPLVA